MYSGGRESVLLLHQLVKEGHDPTIIHVRHGRMTDYYERMVKRNAMRIHKTDAYYVFETDSYTYDAQFTHDGVFSVKLSDDEELYPHEFGNPVYIGYWKRDNPSQKTLIEHFKDYRVEKYKFPLADYRYHQIEKLWKKLPVEVQKNTVSSTGQGWNNLAKDLPLDVEKFTIRMKQKYGDDWEFN